MRNAAGELTYHLHLLRLGELLLQALLLGGLDAVDDGRFLITLPFLDRGDVETGKALGRSLERGIDRGNFALPLRRLADRGFQRRAVALGNDGEDGALVLALVLEHRIEQPREQRV